MLDIRFVRENPDLVKENIKNKFQDAKVALVDEVIELDKQNRAAITEADQLRADRNRLSKMIGGFMAKGEKDKAEETKKLLSNLPYKGSNVYPVLSLVDSECCKRWEKDGAEFLVVGRKYEPGEGNSKLLCLSSLGGILAEPAHIQILDLILEKKKVTCFDVNVGVGFKGNTGYYQLFSALKEDKQENN